MSLLRGVDGDLAAVQSALTLAEGSAAQAERTATDVAARAADAGWTGIAGAMAGVRRAAADLRAEIDHVAAPVEDVRALVAAATNQASPEQTTDVLARAVAALDRVRGGVEAARTHVAQVTQQATRALDGGRPEPMLARLRAIGSVLDEGVERCTAAQRSVEAALTAARRVGADAIATPGSDRRSVSREPPDGVHLPYVPGFLERLPIRHRGDEPTDGVLTTPDGARISDVTSGWRGPGHGGPRLRRPWRNMMSAIGHAEGHAAALMRKHKIREATLYVNNQPCPDAPWGCDRILPEILPGGSRLTIYGPDGYVKTYDGNGKGVAWPP